MNDHDRYHINHVNNVALQQAHEAKLNHVPTALEKDLGTFHNAVLMTALFHKNKPEYDRICGVVKQHRYDQERAAHIRR